MDQQKTRLGNLIKQARKKKGWTMAELAEKIGLTTSAVQKYERGGGFTRDSASKLSKALGLSLNDLYGIEEGEQVTDPGKFNGNLYVSSNSMDVPLVNQYAYAGYMSGYSDEEYINELPTFPFPIEDKTFKGNYMAFEVKGDSMDDGTADGYQSGIIVLGREIQQHHWRNKLHINQWDFVIVHRTDGILIKRITEHDVPNGILTLHSLNDYYEDFTVTLDDVVQIFNVISSMSKRRR